ncbi:MerR family transcriptional regulator [Streptomyces sp. AJS327]|uniref:transcriptional regulator FtsR n=1 Tax=Streptomyces sp. AJS327 TaxID=2545265 RepID=UPI0021556630|nr:MerR family transcriptional regulator [Streptomyces sp. AJS327]
MRPDGVDSITETDTGPAASVSVGAAVEALREEFPELSVTVVRFLEAEGLLGAERARDAPWKLSPAAVGRIREVLRLRRDQALPLAAIRARLDDGGGVPVLPSPTPAEGGGVEAAPPPVSRAELLAVTGADEPTLTRWEAYGLLGPRGALTGPEEEPESDEYAAEDLAVARLCAELGRYGLEPRHLRSTKAAAERMAGLVEQVTAPLRRGGARREGEPGAAAARELAALSARLYTTFLHRELGLTERGRYTDADAERVPDYPNRPGSA